MRTRSRETMKRIVKFVDRFSVDNKRTPSTAEIAEGVGLVKSTAYRYLLEMKDLGIIQYDGRDIITEAIRKTKSDTIRAAILGSVSCGIPMLEEEYVEAYLTLPAALFGKGEFFLLRANGDSMIDLGIADNDLVLIKKQPDCEIGDIVVALDENNENTLKIYGGIDKKSNKVILRYANEKTYPGKVILVNELVIQGVAKHVIKEL